MMKVNNCNKMITLTRGDTLTADIVIKNYQPCEDDTIKFALAKDYDRTEIIYETEIQWDKMVLIVPAEVTENLEYDEYYYSIRIVLSDGTVDTFINKGTLIITKTKGDYLAHDIFNFGNFLWGAAMGRLGISPLMVKVGSNVDAMIHTGSWDSNDDQRSIWAGYKYVQK